MGHREYTNRLKPFSQELRALATLQENRLWYQFLRDFRPRFTRQRIVGRYILDFFCAKVMLAVELDGSQHDDKHNREYDDSRTLYLNQYGIDVLRFANREVDNNFGAVCEKILKTVLSRQT
jgi:very-short-patch-repair endonuclease